MPKYYHIVTFGCQMNKNDSERAGALLKSLGMKETPVLEKADLVLVNTCSVRQTAEDRTSGINRKILKLKKQNPNLIFAVTGCMPGRDKDGRLRKKIPSADLFFPIIDLPRLPAWLKELRPNWFDIKFEDVGEYWTIDPKRELNYKASITIQIGCNNFCSYCVVPYARGREKNRPVKEILAEIKKAVKNGAKEITLLGQVVNNYRAPDPENYNKKNLFSPSAREGVKGRKENDFAALLWEVNNIPGDFRIFYTAPDPQHFDDFQIKALSLPKMVNYLHLPVQAGDNEILKKMNRKYTREQYIKLIKKIRVQKPEIAIGTDIIVGFCGETKKQFEQTVDLYKKCDFDIAYLAMYSERSGTVAAKIYKDDVSMEEKKRRWRVLQDLMEEIVLRKNQKYLGQVVEVLVDEFKDGVCTGNSNEMKLVQFLGNKKMVGKLVKVKINFAEKWIFKGEAFD
jgi:tRNA-2-methylthio-N6-dimethylallyladenosine synthase